MELVKHETCPQYVSRRLSEGWRIVEQGDFKLVLQSPEGIIRPVDLRNDVETLRPNAAGDECNISNQAGAACPNHYQNVDETPADDATTTVSEAVSTWKRDLYNLPASTGSGTINFIKVYIKCLADGSAWADARYRTAIKSNSTATDGNIETPSNGSTWEYFSTQYNLNPADAGAWEWADIDALQIGVSLLGANRGSAYCTQVYVEVDYVGVSAPTVTTQAATDIQETTATGNGNITDTGGENCDERGFDWDTDSGAPYANSATDTDSFGAGAFTKGLTGLPAGTLIYYRAKAHNSAGWGYGGEQSFYTNKSLTRSDAGAGADAKTDYPAGVIEGADAGAGVDAKADYPAATIAATLESATGADAKADYPVGTITGTLETATGAELAALLYALLLTDAASGADAKTDYPSALFDLVESALGAETVAALEAFLSGITDAGIGGEAKADYPDATHFRQDTAQGSEWAAIIEQAINVVDSAAGTEALAKITALIEGQDQAVGVESLGARTLAAIDSAVGAEVVAVLYLLSVLDSATGGEAATVGFILSGSDSATGTDTASLLAQLAGVDAATAAELIASRMIEAIDSASAGELATLFYALTKVDAAVGSELAKAFWQFIADTRVSERGDKTTKVSERGDKTTRRTIKGGGRKWN